MTRRGADETRLVEAADPLAGTALQVGPRLMSRLAQSSGVFTGESVTRRLDRLALALGLSAATEPMEG